MLNRSRAESIAEELKAFRHSAQLFSESQPNLRDAYPNRWVAIHEGRVLADAPDLEELAAKVVAAGFTPAKVMFRFLAKEPRTLIL